MVESISDAREVWADCPRYPGYTVSDHGNVAGPRGFLKPYRDRDGYPRIGVGRSNVGLHRMVAEAFLGPCPEGHEVAHKDHDRANARLDNLEYLTHADNVKATAAAGRSMRGADHVNAVLTDAAVLSIRATYKPRQKPTLAELGEQYGVPRETIWKVVKGQTWKHLLGSSQQNQNPQVKP